MAWTLNDAADFLDIGSTIEAIREHFPDGKEHLWDVCCRDFRRPNNFGLGLELDNAASNNALFDFGATSN
jgi:hypothetical protein